jgi:hypothetical protein
MPRLLLRASSVLFIVTGILVGITRWVAYHASLHSSLVDASTNAKFSIAEAITTILGFLTLTAQARAERHWLGWLGIVMALVGSFMSMIVAIALLTSGREGFTFGSNSNLLLLVEMSTPLFALGLVFWAMDLTNTTKQLLFQKALMGALACLPFFYTAALQQLSVRQINIDQSFLGLGAINALIWWGLGASIWFYRSPASPIIPAQEADVLPDSSFELTISPLPSSESEDDT